MKRCALAALVLLAIFVPAGLAEAASTRTGFTQDLFEALGAQRVACPQELEHDGWAAQAACAVVPFDLESLKKAVESYLSRGRDRDSSRMFKTPWVLLDGRAIRRLLRAPVLDLIFEPRERKLIVLPYSCFSDALLAHSGLLSEPDDGLVDPRRVKDARPEYPARARRSRANGAVVLQAVIASDGKVSDVCVIEARPEGLGFAEASIDAVRRWRYEPPMKDGKPVAALTTVVVEFYIR